jgi:hypothetical protein
VVAFKDVHSDIEFVLDAISPLTERHVLEGMSAEQFLDLSKEQQKSFFVQRRQAVRDILVLKAVGIFQSLNDPGSSFGKVRLLSVINSVIDKLSFIDIDVEDRRDVDTIYAQGLAGFAETVGRIFGVANKDNSSYEQFLADHKLETNKQIVEAVDNLYATSGNQTSLLLTGIDRHSFLVPLLDKTADESLRVAIEEAQSKEPKPHQPLITPEVSQNDIWRGVLEKASADDKPIIDGGRRLYSNEEIDKILALPDVNFHKKNAIRAAERQAMKFSLRNKSKSSQKRLETESFEPSFDSVAQATVTPPPDAEQQLQSDIRDEAQIQAEVDNLIPVDPQQEIEEPPPPDPGESAGKSLGENESFPSPDVVRKANEGEPNVIPNKPQLKVTFVQREAPVIPEEVWEEVRPQIDPTVEPEKYRPPPLVPLGSLTEFALFMEPISRQVFTLIVAKPTGFFYVGIHVPCMYPIILPPFYPVSNLGPPPAGAFAMAFIDPTIPYCGGSQPFDAQVFYEGVGVVPLNLAAADPAGIKRCDYNLPADKLAECVREQQAKMQEHLQGQPVPPELARILKIIAEQAQVPDPVVPADPVPPQEQVIFEVVDGLEQISFELDIIE